MELAFDSAAFNAKLVEALPRVRQYCMKLTKNAAAADDLLQETSAKALQAGASYAEQPGVPMRAWLMRIARNTFLTGVRKYHREQEDPDGVLAGKLTAPEAQTGAINLSDALEALNELSERDQTLIGMAVSGDAYEEMAERINAPLGTVKSALSRARDKLEAALSDDYRPEPSRRFTEKPALNPAAVWGLADDHPAMTESRTLFPTTVVEVTEEAPDRLFVSGVNNRKLGAEVTKGRFKGYALYGLSLEERATCPASCAVRDICYGNGMQMARRHRIGDEDVFFDRMAAEIADLALTKHPGGVLFRLHVLGDFPSVGYVAEWADVLEEYPNVAVYGYTARRPKILGGDEIGDAIANVKERYPDRFRIRASMGAGELVGDTSTVIEQIPDGPKDEKGRMVCPAQTDATACCASCGLCWEDAFKGQPIAFVKHGPKSAAAEAQREMIAAAAGVPPDNDVGTPIRKIQATEGRIRDSHKPRVGPPPEIRLVDPKDLLVEGAYQRDLSNKSVKLIKKIITEWSWAKFKPPICAERPDGRLAVVDGQHTAIGAASLDIKQIPVLIAAVDTLEQRAGSFVSHNTDRVIMSPFQIFHANVTAGDAIALMVAAAAEKAGATIPRSMPPRGRGKPGQIIGVRDVCRIAKSHGVAHLERIFRIAVMAEAAPLGVTATRSLHMLLTEAYFAANAKMPDSRIANALKSITDFEAKARAAGEATGQGQVRAGAAMIAEACTISLESAA